MAHQYSRKEFPPNVSPSDFTYHGRPAKDQDDFGTEVGIADLKCVNQFGDVNSNKYYHAGVVKAGSTWFLYCEWGRARDGRSWVDGCFTQQDFQFTECVDEDEARSLFQKKCRSKNVKNLDHDPKTGIWTAKVDSKGKAKSGYIVQSLATREKGLPDAYKIKDGVATTKKKAAKKATAKPETPEQKLAYDLMGGVRDYVQRAVQASGGVLPTLDTIEAVRDTHIPTALERIAKVQNKTRRRKSETGGEHLERIVLACTQDTELQKMSNFVASLVPRPDPGRSVGAEERARKMILSPETIPVLEADLVTYESGLKNEDFDVVTGSGPESAEKLLNAQVRLLPVGDECGDWVRRTYGRMTNNRHHYIKSIDVINVFEVIRPDRDAEFVNCVKAVAAKRKGPAELKARLQPKQRWDVSDIADEYEAANVFLGIHGTRDVNVAPILQTNLRLPKSLPTAKITGAAFGGGIYAATDKGKSLGYTSSQRAYWVNGGDIKGRGNFMFLQDVIMGKAYKATRTGSWSTPPNGCDSIAAFPEFSTVKNDEHIIFNPSYQRIRYLIEFEAH